MDKLLKYTLIEKIMATENEIILNQIRNLLFEDEMDFWNSLDEDTKESINRGVNDYQEGKVRTHSMVMEELYQKYNLSN
ncbi:hypothetical protein [Belliella pelovolcani]|uniref:Uncharacterized protein n=1 Tax=Belliella pelovolcani TaxID=529505 RepID=A0A1N7M5I3_9BACT|nr:hypothetical protein [Belliella pelovolcani]SIS81365.1 hypothetical protein SAMN05421761_105116 [Belliella pelovolcani]